MFKKIFLNLFCIIVLLPICIFSWLLVGPGGVYTEVDHGEDKVILIEKGSRSEDIAQILLDKNLIQNQYIYYAALLLSQQYGKLKAGEFLIPAHARPYDIMKILCCGRVIVHSITFPEGIIVTEVVERLNQLDNLKGAISVIPEEGTLLPETYTYVYGDTKNSILTRMEKSMVKVVTELWEKRPSSVNYKDIREVIIMASIIEKETSRPEERSHIAAVFLNRLKKGMKLQSDPTVTYGLTLGKSKLGRDLLRADLTSQTLYNTYVINGLPPSPIACPGIDALKAALNPIETNDLFFVANGTGGHTFSSTYAQHSSHVQVWRNIRKSEK